MNIHEQTLDRNLNRAVYAFVCSGLSSFCFTMEGICSCQGYYSPFRVILLRGRRDINHIITPYML